MSNQSILDRLRPSTFLGYSGWSEDQLEGEIEQDSWIITDINSDEMFVKNPESMWQNLLLHGSNRQSSSLPIHRFYSSLR